MPRPTRYCWGCKQQLNPNAFPRRSSLCYPCADARKTQADTAGRL
ncbi:MAG: hypothetical protein PF501_18935 [Salinisphaera sp.]|jgi:hypothetical protein|nr:hypothetical protein [Salinisphaera sp.]